MELEKRSKLLPPARFLRLMQKNRRVNVSRVITCCSGQPNALEALEFPSCLLISKLWVGGNNQQGKVTAGKWGRLLLVQRTTLFPKSFALSVHQVPSHSAVGSGGSVHWQVEVSWIIIQCSAVVKMSSLFTQLAANSEYMYNCFVCFSCLRLTLAHVSSKQLESEMILSTGFQPCFHVVPSHGGTWLFSRQQPGLLSTSTHVSRTTGRVWVTSPLRLVVLQCGLTSEWHFGHTTLSAQENIPPLSILCPVFIL